MDESQAGLDQASSNADDVLGSVGVESGEGSQEPSSLAKESDPYDVKKRLGQQAKKHQREMRQMQEQIARMQSQMQPQQQPDMSGQYMQQPQQQQPMQGQGMDDPIQKAVRFAMQAQEEQARRAKDAERMAHVHKQYQRMNSEFDKAADKYEDFDDVVRGDAPFTESIRDALLLVDNPADVAYKLGKNRDDLSRISQLHPLDQAREVNKLSFALMGGNAASGQKSNAQSSNPMSQSKPNPVSSSAATSAAQIRARMKAGSWK